MSDDATGDLDFKEIAEKINKRTKPAACPFCRCNIWYILNEIGSNKGISGMVVATNWQGLPAYTLFCQNCGFVRQHLKQIIDGEARPSGEAT